VVDNIAFPISPDGGDPSRIRELSRCRKRERKLKKRFRTTADGGGKSQQASRLRAFQGSRAIRICAAVDVNKKQPEKYRKCLQELFSLGTISWNKPVDEKSVVSAKPKSNGKFRVTHRLETGNRTINQCWFCLLKLFLKRQPFQYEFKGKGNGGGMAYAIRDVRKAILAGNVFVAHLDIKEFFANFTEEGIRKLIPLLKGVSLHAMGEHLVKVVLKDKLVSESLKDIILFEARRGGPQGSALSAILAQIIVSRLNWDSNLPLFNFADNFLILGPTKEDVTKAAIALREKVSHLIGGHFELTTKFEGHASEGFEFLGHTLTLENGLIATEAASYGRLMSRLEILDKQASKRLYPISDADKPGSGAVKVLSPAILQEAFILVGRMWQLTNSWCQVFKECDDIDEVREFVRCQVEEHRKALETTWKALDDFKHPEGYWKDWYP
jgi:hypothetical protein